MDDLIRVKNDFGIEKQIRINSAWFQQYNKAHAHSVHNHGFGGFSSVLYLKFDPVHHKPTTFVAPFLNNMDGNVCLLQDALIWGDENGHYVKPKQVKRKKKYCCCW